MSGQWDETWRRLNPWTDGQVRSERLAAQIALHEGFTDLDPIHPRGGPDGGKDALMKCDGRRWALAVYFPSTGPQTDATIKAKFVTDVDGAKNNHADGIAFVTNQYMTEGLRESLHEASSIASEIYHLERIGTILSQPVMLTVRQQFLGIEHPGIMGRLCEVDVPLKRLLRKIEKDGSGAGGGGHLPLDWFLQEQDAVADLDDELRRDRGLDDPQLTRALAGFLVSWSTAQGMCHALHVLDWDSGREYYWKRHFHSLHDAEEWLRLARERVAHILDNPKSHGEPYPVGEPRIDLWDDGS